MFLVSVCLLCTKLLLTVVCCIFLYIYVLLSVKGDGLKVTIHKRRHRRTKAEMEAERSMV